MKNTLDNSIHNVTKSLNDYKDKISQEIVSEVEAALT